MQNDMEQTAGAKLVVFEDDRIRTFGLEARTVWRIGRFAPGISNIPDICLTSKIVSREHGWIQNIDNQWFFVDNPRNLNGTYHNGVKVPRRKDGIKTPVMLESGDVLKITDEDRTHADPKGVVMLFTTEAAGEMWTVPTAAAADAECVPSRLDGV